MVELEAIGAIMVCKSFRDLVGAEHLYELLAHGLKEFPVREPKS
jgi:hypothetical protein